MAASRRRRSVTSKRTAPAPRSAIRSKCRPLVRRSAKAACVAGLIKVVLSLQHEAIPAHLHLEKLNPHVAWEDLPLTVPTALTAWRRSSEPRIAGVSSFGFSGTNVHVVIEEAPAATERTPSPTKRPVIAAVSARSEEALAARIEDIARVLETTDSVGLIDVAHTLNAGRAHLPVRVAAQA